MEESLLKPDYQLFVEEMERRGIEYLVHFTNLSNLIGILKTGAIYPRWYLNRENFEYVVNDEMRLDSEKYINLSIMHPNFCLLQKMIEKSSDIWCILKIDKKYIYNVYTEFSVTNAANYYNKMNIGITGDLEKFKMMFMEEIKFETSGKVERIIYRKVGNMFPTDIQAEVLCRYYIPINDITEICFANSKELYNAKIKLFRLFKGNIKIPMSVNSQFFRKERY